MTAMIIGLVGCGSTNATETEIIGGADGPTSTFLASKESKALIPGTWETGSMGYEYYGELQPEYYVQFSDSEIIYGHMKKGEFIKDHADKITSFEELPTGGYEVRVDRADGSYYKYTTYEGDENILEYHWTESKDGPENYSGGASLEKCE